MEKRIVPSILSADFSNLGQAVATLEKNGCDLFHIDVMDGRFVPNITFGPKLVHDLAGYTKARFDVHLMVSRPENVVPLYDYPAVEVITVQPEATVHLHRILQRIRSMGKKAGASLNPATPLSAVENVLPDLDLLLIMSVNPGFGGQEFIEQMTDKIGRAAELSAEYGFIVEVDGGLDSRTIPPVIRAGADWLVVGSSIYDETDPAGAFDQLSKIVRNAAR